MTQADFISKYGRMAMKYPFANNDTTNFTAIEQTKAAGDFNFETGFNTPYSAPKSGGGKFVTRKEMNAIGNLASRNNYYDICGGINTFDQSLCDLIGGYPKGAILEYLLGLKLYKVISMVDNNTVNFVNDGIDTVNWQYLNQDNAEAGREVAMTFSVSVSSQSTIGVFQAAKSTSTFLCENKLTQNYSASSTMIIPMREIDIERVPFGTALLISDLGTSYSSIPDPPTSSGSSTWKSLSGNYGEIVLGTVASLARITVDIDYWNFDQFSGLTKDHYYAILAFGAFQDAQFAGQEDTTASAQSVADVTISKFSLSGKFTIYY